uniref:DUF4283 domain-containing protein n=1 Tax=Arundo donax TaxID=35708 RepID=A0A0A8YM69_ARUDO
MGRVKGGHISVEQVISELKRLIPVQWSWEVKEHAEDAFLVTFPNIMERNRLVGFGEVNVKHHPGIKLEFEVWGPEDEVMI